MIAPRVLVVGSINMDLVVGSRRMPQPGETIMGHTFATVPGGKGANQAVAAARLGAQVTFMGCVGGDEFGSELRKGLQREGISTQFLTSKAEVASGVALIQVDEKGENAITVVPGANSRLKLVDIPGARAAIEDADIVLIQLEIPLSTVAFTISCCRGAKVRIILDPAPVPAEPIPEQLYQVDVLSPNQHEAEALTGIPITNPASAHEAAAMLVERGARQVVLKMGAAGAFVLDEAGVATDIGAFEAKVVDTTAAGDAFTAALGVGLARGMNAVEAARLGCAAGSLAVSKPGAQDAMPHWKDVAGLIQ